MTARVLVACADSELLRELARLLAREDLEALVATSAAAARERAQAERPELALVDLDLPGARDLELLDALVALPDAPATLALGPADVERAVRAMQAGAADYRARPIDAPALSRALFEVARRRGVPSSAPASSGAPALVGRSSGLLRVLRAIERAASVDAPVLLHGEPGTGKELAARTIHALSSRAERPFAALACASLATAAETERRLAELDGGSAFLDELADLAPGPQAALLAHLRAGSGSARILAATSRELDRLSAAPGAGSVRADLVYRVNVLALELPPLRERKDDVPLLARHFLARARERGARARSFSAAALARLAQHAWPGNVRELASVVLRATALCGDGEIRPEHLQLPLPLPARAESDVDPEPVTLRELEEKHVRRTLARANGNRSRAARLLGINRATLYAKLERYGLAAETAGQQSGGD